jgi:hypothetical protein
MMHRSVVAVIGYRHDHSNHFPLGPRDRRSPGHYAAIVFVVTLERFGIEAVDFENIVHISVGTVPQIVKLAESSSCL